MNTETGPIYTVSQLNGEAKRLLEHTFHTIRLVGEISNLVCAPSGHFYFSLKDLDSQIRCAFFRYTHQQSAIKLNNGQEVIVHARVTLYEPRGEFQLVIQSIESTTDGILQRAFEQLKKKLAAEGLFEPSHKKIMPRYPQVVGVITSPTGAALQDILHVLQRRCPIIEVIVYPTLVQGTEASTQIVAAIERANRHRVCDVLILARGGGSLEDLWAFNEEKVARAIFNSQLPLISGVGHEIDFTIADLVADYRAPTPSAAAECVSPDSQTWHTQLQHALERFTTLVRHQLQNHHQNLDYLQKRLRHPQQQINERLQCLTQQKHQFLLAFAHSYENKKNQLSNWSQRLHNISPLQTLKRGYAIATDQDNHIIFTHKNLKKDDVIQVLLADGRLNCRIENIHE